VSHQSVTLQVTLQTVNTYA